MSGRQRVMMINDVSKQVCWSAIRWAVYGLSLKAGDEFILLGLVHTANHPSALDFFAAAKQLGFVMTVKNSDYIREEEEEEIDGREDEETHTYIEMLVLYKQCQAQNIKLHIEVREAVSRKAVAVQTAKDLEITSVVLDREMKKHKKLFVKKLRCGIWKLKSDNRAELVRGPITTTININAQSKTSADQMSYDQMIPSSQEFSFSKGGIVHPKRHHTPTRHSNGEINHESSPNEESKAVVSGPISCRIEINKDELMDGEMKVRFSNSVCSFCKNRRPNPGVKKKDFTYAELREATGGFLAENYLSEGGFGCVYKGKLKNGMRIAVKQHKNNISLQGEKEFKSEVDVLSRARHENLVVLLGSCSQGNNHRLLVYEYVCNGSLDHHLSSDAMIPLNWEQRLKIALGGAKGLEYLHSQKIIHRDIRPNNILITHDHESLLGDFGLARASSDDSNHFSNESVVGTMGYVAPEYAESGKLSTKTDVYSFGVVLLQLITGLSNTDKNLKGRSLLAWAQPLLEQKNYPRLIDRRIVDSHDVHQLFGMVQLVEECLRKDPSKRPPMKCVVDTLTDIIQGTELRKCCPSKPYSFSNAMEHKKEVQVEDTNNGTSKQSSEVRRVGFKSSETKSMRRRKLLYDEMIL